MDRIVSWKNCEDFSFCKGVGCGKCNFFVDTDDPKCMVEEWLKNFPEPKISYWLDGVCHNCGEPIGEEKKVCPKCKSVMEKDEYCSTGPLIDAIINGEI